MDHIPPPEPGDRLALELGDYGILRHGFHNFGRLADGVYRSNQPTPERLRRETRRLGLRSVINLRGPQPNLPYWRLEKAAAAELGLVHRDLTIHARKAASAEEYLALIAGFRDLPRPLLFHCKSGADRAGMAAALYRLAIEGTDIDTARAELSWRWLHFRQSATGVLDRTLDAFEASGATDIEDWLRTGYDPGAVA